MCCLFKIEKDVFKLVVERTMKNVFLFCHLKAHIKHYDNKNITKNWGTN
eukprot:UN24264